MVGAISAVVLTFFATLAVWRTISAQERLNLTLRQFDEDATIRMFARYEQEMRE